MNHILESPAIRMRIRRLAAAALITEELFLALFVLTPGGNAQGIWILQELP